MDTSFLELFAALSGTIVIGLLVVAVVCIIIIFLIMVTGWIGSK